MLDAFAGLGVGENGAASRTWASTSAREGVVHNSKDGRVELVHLSGLSGGRRDEIDSRVARFRDEREVLKELALLDARCQARVVRTAINVSYGPRRRMIDSRFSGDWS